MNRSTLRLWIILGVILGAFYYLYPTYRFYFSPPTNLDELNLIKQRSINLGLDLQGGIHLVLEVDPSKLTEDERHDVVDRVKEIITNRVDQFGVSEPIIHREGNWRIVVELPGVQDVERAKKLIGKTARLEFKILEPNIDREALLDKIETHISTNIGDSTENDTSELFKDPLKSNKISLKNLIHSYGGDLVVPKDNELTVREILSRPDLQKLIPPDTEFIWGSKLEEIRDQRDYRYLYYVKRRVEMTGEIVKDAKVTTGQAIDIAGQSIINFTTTDEGIKIFSRVTGAHVQERMAIILDDKVYSAPTIQVKIRDGRSIITGSANIEEAKDLAIVLRAGALPADVNIIEDRTVGPSLGLDSIEQGRKAATIGLALVAIFMIFYYGLSGLVANLALLLNLLFVMAILAGFGGTLTLPGIAGIILTIGMAVDANVLIFERIREEIKTGKTLRTAIGSGYSRALLAIIDANLTTIITAIVLYQYGTGPIKGFALTLIIGILSSMFTALFVTRTIFDFSIQRWNLTSLNLGRLTIFKDANFNILRLRRGAFIGSILVILIGLGSTITKGGYNLGIDFSGGTLLELHFNPSVPVGDIRKSLSNVELDDQFVDLRQSEIKEFGTPNDILIRVEEEAKGTQMADAIKTVLKSQFGENIGDETQWLRRQEAVGPKIGAELKWDAIKAILLSLILIVLYIWWRFKQIQFGIAAVVALLHDVLITLGVFSLTNKEISLGIVASLLTIVGYSLNDTIVVFDRIREDLRLYKRDSFLTILNRSINKCLNRTFLTSCTTLLVVLSLLFLGGEVISDFAFSLLIGIIVGTYSSSFVASPIVLEWQTAVTNRSKSLPKRRTT